MLLEEEEETFFVGFASFCTEMKSASRVETIVFVDRDFFRYNIMSKELFFIH